MCEFITDITAVSESENLEVLSTKTISAIPTGANGKISNTWVEDVQWSVGVTPIGERRLG